MEYIVDQDGQIVNLYKLKEGSVNSSCALPIAKSILLGPVACSRAEEVSTVNNTRTNRFSIVMGHKTEPALTTCFLKIHVSAIIVSWQQSFIFPRPIPIHRKILYVFLVWAKIAYWVWVSHRLGDWGTSICFPEGPKIFSSPQYLEPHWGQLGIQFLFLEVKLQEMKLTAHIHLLLRSRMFLYGLVLKYAREQIYLYLYLQKSFLYK